MAAYYGPNYKQPVTITFSKGTRIATQEEEAVMWHALFSDNPTVRSAIENLVIATKLAHGEDIAIERRNLSNAVQHVIEQQRLVAEAQENIEREKEEMRRAGEGRRRLALFCMASVAVISALFMFSGF